MPFHQSGLTMVKQTSLLGATNSWRERKALAPNIGNARKAVPSGPHATGTRCSGSSRPPGTPHHRGIGSIAVACIVNAVAHVLI